MISATVIYDNTGIELVSRACVEPISTSRPCGMAMNDVDELTSVTSVPDCIGRASGLALSPRGAQRRTGDRRHGAPVVASPAQPCDRLVVRPRR